MKSEPEPSKITTLRNISTAVVIGLVAFWGYPWFWYTTSIHRAELPVDKINYWNSQIGQVKFEIPVYLSLPNAKDDFVPRAQAYVDDHLYAAFPDLRDVWALKFERAPSSEQVGESDYLVEFEIVSDRDDGTERGEAVAVSPIARAVKLVLSNRVLVSDRVDEFIYKVLIEDVFAAEIKKFRQLALGHKSDTNLVFPYSDQFNLIFSLLVENGKEVQWEIGEALASLQPAIDTLRHFVNFTVSTQVQYYSGITSHREERNGSYVITQSDLSTFVNVGDWNLENNDINPTINLVTYFPSSNYDGKPLLIEGSATNSFMVPQWGGVVIHNKAVTPDTPVVFTQQELVKLLETFTSQLFQLLGSSQTPKSVPFRVDTMTRWSVYNNLKESLRNLNSLVKLTNSLSEIAIPDETKNFIDESLSYLNSTVLQLNEHRFNEAMASSAKCLENSNKAFFDKEIVQQVYFPSEHKMAVFLPLVGPILSILLFTVLRLVKNYKASGRLSL